MEKLSFDLAKVLIIGGTGNVGGIAAQKLIKRPDVFKEVHIGARHQPGKILREKLEEATANGGAPFFFHEVDVTYSDLAELVSAIKPNLLINLCPPYYNMILMEVCLICDVHYLDTACFERVNQLGFSHDEQLALHGAFYDYGLVAQLQTGFDPGVTNAFVALCIQENMFDEIYTVDILDANNGSKITKTGWAPNFDPEINIRELILPITAIQAGRKTNHGRLVDEDPVHFRFNFYEAGEADAYLMGHEEVDSLHESFPNIPTIRFWMTFDKKYLNNLSVLYNLGLTGIDPVEYESGVNVIPVRFLKKLLPKGDDFNHTYSGKTCIGCIISGRKDGKYKVIHIYQICDHHEAFLETGGNAIGYTTAVPAATAAVMMMKSGEFGIRGPWLENPGVFVPENQPVRVFLDEMARMGLPWKIKELTELPEFLRGTIKERAVA